MKGESMGKPKNETISKGDVATVQSGELIPSSYKALSVDTKQLTTFMRDNLGGQGFRLTDLDKIKVPSGGGSTWEVPTLQGNKPYQVLGRSYVPVTTDEPLRQARLTLSLGVRQVIANAKREFGALAQPPAPVEPPAPPRTAPQLARQEARDPNTGRYRELPPTPAARVNVNGQRMVKRRSDVWG